MRTKAGEHVGEEAGGRDREDAVETRSRRLEQKTERGKGSEKGEGTRDGGVAESFGDLRGCVAMDVQAVKNKVNLQVCSGGEAAGGEQVYKGNEVKVEGNREG